MNELKFKRQDVYAVFGNNRETPDEIFFTCVFADSTEDARTKVPEDVEVAYIMREEDSLLA